MLIDHTSALLVKLMGVKGKSGHFRHVGIPGHRGGSASVKSVFEFNYKNYSTSVSKVEEISPGVDSVSGGVYYDGQLVGDFVYQLNHNDKLATFISLYMPENIRGAGFGTKWQVQVEDNLRALGFRELEVHASGIGAYVWARLGFDWKNQEDGERLGRKLMDLYTKRYGSDFDQRVWTAAHGRPYQIAEFRGPDNYALGKDVLIGESWLGYKDLTDPYFKNLANKYLRSKK